MILYCPNCGFGVGGCDKAVCSKCKLDMVNSLTDTEIAYRAKYFNVSQLQDCLIPDPKWCKNINTVETLKRIKTALGVFG